MQKPAPSLLAAGLALALSTSGAAAAEPATGAAVATKAGHAETIASMRKAAQAFLDSLDADLHDKAMFDIDDPERKRWSNLPAAAFKREGVSFDEMSPEQRRLAHQLIQSPLSSQGYLKATGIMRLDQLLQDFSRTDPPMFGHGLYWIGVFGDPSSDEPWGWQLDGHHLALNFTVASGELSITPAFLGADPAEVRTGAYAGWYILGEEDRRGRELFESLDAQQRTKAILGETAPRDVIAGPGRADRLQEIAGLPATEMTDDQREALMRLIGEYAHNMEHDVAHVVLERIREAGIEKLHFAWAGTTPGAPYYYRIHGPTVLIEFDNSYPPGGGRSVNHIHTVWREPTNDYGADLLRRHYLESPHHQGSRRGEASK